MRRTVFILLVLFGFICIPNQSEAHKNIVNELVFMWNTYYDQSGIRKKHQNRKNFKKYAQFVEKSIQKLKLEFKEDGNSRGLPISYPKYDKYLHIIIGAMALKETNVKPHLVGKKGEVGVLQVWGAAQGKYKKKVIKNNPELGFYLGIRWLLHCLYLSGKQVHDLMDYSNALSYYVCGPKCKGKIIGAVKKRMKLAYIFQGGFVRPIERVIEAVSYELSGGDSWLDEFDSKRDAENVLKSARKSTDEESKEYLVELYFDGINFEEDYDTMFRKLMNKLKQDIKEN